ncbi:hypothetical protein NS274_09815 [Pseudomonas oryzihabitans]|nr:hypothetical protein NS274_09815 [Pseudomonas psychrotolerans]KTT64889.1 hypothetical protein NS383_12525 [Pseudomonas psychrotolerans]
MADLTLPEVITRFRSNETRIADFTNGNAAGYYTTVDGKKVETLPDLGTRLAAAIAAARGTSDTLKASTGADQIGYGSKTVAAALSEQTTTLTTMQKAVDAALPLTGGTLTGPLLLAGGPTEALHPASKKWTEDLVGAYWKPKVGDTLVTTAKLDATYIQPGAIYLQSAYPELFGLLGFIDADQATNINQLPSSIQKDSVVAYGQDAVLIAAECSGSGTSSIYRSTDYGSNFAKVFTLSSGVFYQIASDTRGVWIAVGNNGALVRSDDNGLTWTQISAPLIAGISNYLINCIATDGNGLWIAGTERQEGCTLVSSDNGKTWTARGTGSTTYFPIGLAAGNEGTWVMSCRVNGQLWHVRSIDSGKTWTKTATAYPYYAYGDSDYANLEVSGVAFGAGIFAGLYSTFTNFSGSYYYRLGLIYSLDGGINWLHYGLVSGDSIQPRVGGIHIDKEGVIVCANSRPAMGYNQILKLTGLQSSQSLKASTTNTSGLVSSITSNNLYTWNYTCGVTLFRSDPAYNIKSLFKVPATVVQPPPYKTYVKAKLS